MHGDPLRLEAGVAFELSAILEKISGESKFEVEPSAELCSALERYIPQQLSQHHPEWEGESLDGVLVTSARKVGTGAAELCGVVILISDQTVTPFFLRLITAAPYHSLASYQIHLGEPGGGRLGISGPPYGSSRAGKLMETVEARLSNMSWSYSVTGGAG